MSQSKVNSSLLTVVKAVISLPWIPEPSTVNNKLKCREGSGIQGIISWLFGIIWKLKILHKIKQILHKIKQNTIAKKYRYIGIFFPVSVFGVFQIPQQPTVKGTVRKDLGVFFHVESESYRYSVNVYL
jgi:hypothetical protein